MFEQSKPHIQVGAELQRGIEATGFEHGVAAQESRARGDAINGKGDVRRGPQEDMTSVDDAVDPLVRAGRSASERGIGHQHVPAAQAEHPIEMPGEPLIVGVQQGDPRLRGRGDCGVASRGLPAIPIVRDDIGPERPCDVRSVVVGRVVDH
jgi:hypothetical protein